MKGGQHDMQLREAAGRGKALRAFGTVRVKAQGGAGSL